MCTYNAISSHTDHFEIQKREETLLARLYRYDKNECKKIIYLSWYLFIFNAGVDGVGVGGGLRIFVSLDLL